VLLRDLFKLASVLVGQILLRAFVTLDVRLCELVSPTAFDLELGFVFCVSSFELSGMLGAVLGELPVELAAMIGKRGAMGVRVLGQLGRELTASVVERAIGSIALLVEPFRVVDAFGLERVAGLGQFHFDACELGFEIADPLQLGAGPGFHPRRLNGELLVE